MKKLEKLKKFESHKLNNLAMCNNFGGQATMNHGTQTDTFTSGSTVNSSMYINNVDNEGDYVNK